MHKLALWMLETEHNPYGYLDQGYAKYTSTAEGFEILLSMLHHALYDDGDVTFVTVNKEPKIIFWDKWDDNLKSHVLTDMQKDLESKGYNYEVKVLDIKPNEFGALYDKSIIDQEQAYADLYVYYNNKKG